MMEPALEPAKRIALIALLEFYAESGVDCALADEPIDRFAEELTRRNAVQQERATRDRPEDASRDPARPREAGPRAAPAIPEQLRARDERPASPPLLAPVVMSPAEAEAAARALAAAAQSLEELEAVLAEFDGCTIKNSAKNLIFAGGDPKARAMFVAPAPGADDDREGRVFAGQDGLLLERMLGAIGLGRDSVYFGHIVPWRPAGNRRLTPRELAVCLPFIRRQIQLADPDFLICLGEPAMRELLSVKDPIVRARGRWLDFDTGTRTIRAMAMLHPAYVLKQPLHKRYAWRDLRALKRALAG